MKIFKVQSVTLGFYTDNTLSVWLQFEGQQFGGLRVKRERVSEFIAILPKIAGVQSLDAINGHLVHAEINEQGVISHLSSVLDGKHQFTEEYA